MIEKIFSSLYSIFPSKIFLWLAMPFVFGIPWLVLFLIFGIFAFFYHLIAGNDLSLGEAIGFSLHLGAVWYEYIFLFFILPCILISLAIEFFKKPEQKSRHTEKGYEGKEKKWQSKGNTVITNNIAQSDLEEKEEKPKEDHTNQKSLDEINLEIDFLSKSGKEREL